MSVTGNPIRDEMIRVAIREAQEAGSPVTVAVLGLEHLPRDFDLSQDELDGVVPTMSEPAAVGSVTAEPDAPADEPDAARAMTMADAQERLVRLNNDLSEARGAVLVAQQRQRDARAVLAKAITTFQQGFAPITREALVREHIASAQALKAAVARGEVSPRRRGGPGPSLVDRMAYGHGGVHGTRRASWRRGAYPASEKGSRK